MSITYYYYYYSFPCSHTIDISERCIEWNHSILFISFITITFTSCSLVIINGCDSIGNPPILTCSFRRQVSILPSIVSNLMWKYYDSQLTYSHFLNSIRDK